MDLAGNISQTKTSETNFRNFVTVIKIEMLRCFGAVAQAGNLADAAIRLGRTQSALSMTLKQLEEHLGQPLFESERKSRLSPLGHEVFRLAQQQLRQFDDTIDAIESAAQAPQGLLRVASIPSVADLLLPQSIGELTRRHPSLSIDVRDMDTAGVVDTLLQGHAELGIVSGKPKLNGVEQVTLFEDRFGLLCARDHKLAKESEPPGFDVVFSSNFIRNNLCALIDTPEVQFALPNAKVTVHNTHTLLAMVRSGIWTTILPETVAHAPADTLVFREIAGLQEKRSVSMLIRTRTQFPRFVEEFAEIIKTFVA